MRPLPVFRYYYLAVSRGTLFSLVSSSGYLAVGGATLRSPFSWSRLASAPPYKNAVPVKVPVVFSELQALTFVVK